MNRGLPRRLRTFIVVAVLLTVGGYGLFEGRKIITGPQIIISTPTDGSATSSTAVVIAGSAHNVSFLTINDKPAYTDEYGNFNTRIAAPAGYTVFTVSGTDRFGRQTSEQVHITILNFCPIA